MSKVIITDCLTNYKQEFLINVTMDMIKKLVLKTNVPHTNIDSLHMEEGLNILQLYNVTIITPENDKVDINNITISFDEIMNILENKENINRTNKPKYKNIKVVDDYDPNVPCEGICEHAIELTCMNGDIADPIWEGNKIASVQQQLHIYEKHFDKFYAKYQ